MSSARISSTADVVVIGGGLIGTSIGWRLRQAGLDVAMVVGELLLTRRACRQYEPLLAPMIRSGLLVEGDRSCDNRLLWRALIEAGHNRSFWMPPASGPPPKRPEPWSWVAMLCFLPRPGRGSGPDGRSDEVRRTSGPAGLLRRPNSGSPIR